MSLDSSARRGRGAKRRRIDTTETIVVEPDRATRSASRKAGAEQPARQQKPSPSTRSPREVVPVVRPPDAPFHPAALQLWVVRDAEGKKHLVSEMVPGCRHWRMGDPNVPFCFECKKEGDVLACRTCKRSYHTACLGEDAPADSTSSDTFYCPICVDRGWDVQPPPEILPLTPASSRQSSPMPSSSQAALATDARSQLEQARPPQNDHHAGNELQEPIQSLHDGHEMSVHTETVAVNNQISPARIPRDESVTSTTKAHTVDSRAAALMRTYDLQPPFAASAARQSSNIEKSPAAARVHRPKSRYQTMPDEVDQALTVVYRELESVTALRQDVAALQDRVKTAEQARQILEGRLALERSGQEAIARKDEEIWSLKQQLAELRTAHDSLLQENELLKQRMRDDENTNKAGMEEMQALKASLRRLLGE